MIYLLNELNDTQYKCVTETEGPQLILAGAGSGKTKVITTKIAYLIKEKLVNPQEILAFTFTNKAANEMKDRIFCILNENIDRMYIGTFHSVCVKILRRNLSLPGYDKNFSIYDISDQKTVIKECINELNLDNKIFNPNYLQGKISSLKNEGISPKEYEKFAYSSIDKKIFEIYSKYESKMEENNAFDFDDLIIKTIELMKFDNQVKYYYQQKFQYVFVDEYQDTNNIQYELIKLLSQKHKNICVVGDADQSIYKWRGANINNILNFENDFVDSKKIILSQNYRSTKNILNLANKVIENNTERIEKDLWTNRELGEMPTLHEFNNSTDEAIHVVSKIDYLINEGIKPENIAILYRSNYLSREFEEQLIKKKIKYKVVGGIKFYDRTEIKDLLAYLRLIVNQNDNISFKRIVNSPKRGIGNVTVEKLENIANEKNISLYKSLDFIEKYDSLFDARARKSLNSFKSLIDNLVLKSTLMPITDLLEFLLDRIEYLSILAKINTIEARTKIENIEEFLGSIKNFQDNVGGDLHDFVTSVSLLSDVDKTEDIEDGVSLITVHSAKGLEFDQVFIVGLEEGVFPSAFAESDEDLEEERRLIYVAITRSKNYLYLSYSKSRMRYGKINIQMPSSFIEEMNGLIKSIKPVNKNTKIFKPQENYINTFSFKSNMSKDIEIDRFQEKKYTLGQRVKHKKLGEGIITQIDKSQDDTLITIHFDQFGLKTLIAALAPMEVID